MSSAFLLSYARFARHRHAAIALAVAAGFTTHAAADVVTFPLSAGAINLGSSLTNFQASGTSTQLVRGFMVSGDWSSSSGTARSNEFRARLTSNAPGFFPTNDRAMGGNASTDPFSFGAGATLWANGPVPVSGERHLRGELSRFAPLNSTWTVGLSQSFAGSTAEVSNGELQLFTDAVAPHAGNMASDNTPTYHRAATLSDFGQGTESPDQHRYNTWSFTAPTTGLYLVGAAYRDSTMSQTFDGFLSLYRGDFDSELPVVNLLAIDSDNEVNAGGSAGSSIWIELEAGQQYTAVVSTQLANTSFPLGGGEYTLFAAGAVPSPGAGSIALIGAGIVCFFRRRR